MKPARPKIDAKTSINQAFSSISTEKCFQNKVTVRVLENHIKRCWQH